MKYKQYSKEETQRLIEEIRQNISVLAYAQNELQIPLKQKGSYYFGATEDNNSLVIDPKRNAWWWNSHGVSGNIIHMVMYFENKTKHEAISHLDELLHGTPLQSYTYQWTPPPQKEKVELVLPPADQTYRNVFAYLIKTRHLDKELISELVKDKRIYQDTHKNCVFVTYNDQNQPVFVSKRGTNTEGKRFVGDVAGCDYNYGFHINNHAKKLIVAESPIDALSVATIFKEKGTDKGYDYLALSSANKYKALFSLLEKQSYEEVCLALDNDAGGKKALASISEELSQRHYSGKVTPMLPLVAKDWNEYLVKQQEQRTQQLNLIKDVFPEIATGSLSSEQIAKLSIECAIDDEEPDLRKILSKEGSNEKNSPIKDFDFDKIESVVMDR